MLTGEIVDCNAFVSSAVESLMLNIKRHWILSCVVFVVNYKLKRNLVIFLNKKASLEEDKCNLPCSQSDNSLVRRRHSELRSVG